MTVPSDPVPVQVLSLNIWVHSISHLFPEHFLVPRNPPRTAPAGRPPALPRTPKKSFSSYCLEKKRKMEMARHDECEKRDVQSYNPDFRSRNSAGVWQYLQRECGSGKRQMQCLTHNQVRRLEVEIVKFRDFATLHIYALETLIATYKAQSLRGETCSYYKRYLSELIHAADYYHGYAEWAYKWAYIRQYEENEYYGIPARSTGRTIKKDSDFGGFMGTRKCSGNKCEMQCTQTIKDNTCTATGAGIETLKEQIKNKCQGYINDVKRQLMDFWTENILKTSEMWKKYGEDAKAKLKGAKCQE
ncbi:hypothetical protein AC249_AIPGENE11305 [Exaiptasia diaphana]|nr:hypothetical protein AC249_AIPGENE11305 [Exaiptasia diaphana]